MCYLPVNKNTPQLLQPSFLCMKEKEHVMCASCKLRMTEISIFPTFPFSPSSQHSYFQLGLETSIAYTSLEKARGLAT